MTKAFKGLVIGLMLGAVAQAADPWTDYDGDSLVRKAHKDNQLTVQISGESAKAIFDQLVSAHKLYGKKSHVLSVGEKDIRGKKWTVVQAEMVACGKDAHNRHTCSYFIAPDGQTNSDAELGPAPDGE